MPTYLGLDTETTGLDDPIKVVELAMVKLDDQLNVLETHDTLVCPGRPINEGAWGVHGISDDMVANEKPLDECFPEWLAPDEEAVVIGHNCQFDLKLVGYKLNLVGQICTLSLARQHVHGCVNHKLGTVRDFLGLPKLDEHRALGDTLTSIAILKYIMGTTGLTLSTLVKRQAKPRMILMMPWGKFKGRLITDIEPSYRDWLLDKGNLDPDLRYTLEQLRNL